MGKKKKTEGVSALSLPMLMVGITVAGILAVLAKPAVDSLIARGRMAEVKMNLELIRKAQDAWLFDNTNNSGGTWEQFNAIGYTGSGSFQCSTGANTFQIGGCKSLRYNYTSNVAGTAFEVVAHAPSDSGNWLYPSCNGAGSSVYGKSDGDVWQIRDGGNPVHCRDIRLFCNDSGTANPNCTTALGRGSALRVTPAPNSGSGGGSSNLDVCDCEWEDYNPYPCFLTQNGACIDTWTKNTSRGQISMDVPENYPRGTTCFNLPHSVTRPPYSGQRNTTWTMCDRSSGRCYVTMVYEAPGSAATTEQAVQQWNTKKSHWCPDPGQTPVVEPPPAPRAPGFGPPGGPTNLWNCTCVGNNDDQGYVYATCHHNLPTETGCGPYTITRHQNIPECGSQEHCDQLSNCQSDEDWCRKCRTVHVNCTTVFKDIPAKEERIECSVDSIQMSTSCTGYGG